MNAIIKGKNESANALNRLEFGQSLHQLCHALCDNTPIHAVLPAMANSRRYQAGFGEFVSRIMAAVLNLNLVENFRKIIYGLSPSECSIRRSLGLESRGLGPGPATALAAPRGRGLLRASPRD